LEAKAKKPISLARKAGIFTVSRAVTIASQLAAISILTHLLAKSDADVVLYLLTIYGTAQVFSQLGLPDSVFYFFEKLPPASRKSIALHIGRALLWLSLAGALVMLGIAWLGATREGYSEVRLLIWALMALLLFELPTLPLPNILIALNRAKQAAGLNIFIGLAQFAAITVPLFLPNPVAGICYGLLAYGALRLLVSAAVFSQLFKHEPIKPLPQGTLRELFRYSVPLSLAQVFWGLNRQLDKYIVQWFLPASFAVYAAGAYEIPIIPTIAYSVASVMMPQLVGHYLREERAQLLELWYKSIRKVTVIVLPLVMVFIVAAEEFIALLFPDNYAEAAIPFRIYTFILLQRVASYSNMQKALGSTREITYSAIYGFVINAVLCVPFILWLGLAGPPLASLVANLFTWWYALSRIQLLLKVKFSEVFPFAFYGKALLVAALATLPVFLLKNQLEMPAALGFPVLAASYLLVYLLLAKATNIIPAEDWDRLLRALRVSKNDRQ
jgi:O-antigen/teichoic acid export membrane protein